MNITFSSLVHHYIHMKHKSLISNTLFYRTRAKYFWKNLWVHHIHPYSYESNIFKNKTRDRNDKSDTQTRLSPYLRVFTSNWMAYWVIQTKWGYFTVWCVPYERLEEFQTTIAHWSIQMIHLQQHDIWIKK